MVFEVLAIKRAHTIFIYKLESVLLYRYTSIHHVIKSLFIFLLSKCTNKKERIISSIKSFQTESRNFGTISRAQNIKYIWHWVLYKYALDFLV